MGMAIAAEAQTVSIGPRVGTSLTTLRAFGGDRAYQRQVFNEIYNYTSGAKYGAVIKYSIAGKFSIQPEIIYSQRGYESRTTLIKDDPTHDIGTKLRMNYLEVPLLAKISFGGEKVQGFMTAGPSLGYWMNGKSITTYRGQDEKQDYKFRTDYDYGLKENRIDFGANMGLGIPYLLNSGALNLDVRYGFGLSDIAKYEDDRPEGNPKVGHRSFGVSLAYLFQIK